MSFTIEEAGRRIGLSDVVGLGWVDLVLLQQAMGQYFENEMMRLIVSSMAPRERAEIYRLADRQNRENITRMMRLWKRSFEEWHDEAATLQGLGCEVLATVCWNQAVDLAVSIGDYLTVAYMASDDEVCVRAHRSIRCEYEGLGTETLLKLIGCTKPGTAVHARIAHVLAKKAMGSDINTLVMIYNEIYMYPDYMEDLQPEVLRRITYQEVPTFLTRVLWGTPAYLVLLVLATERVEGGARYDSVKHIYESLTIPPKEDGEPATADRVRERVGLLRAMCVNAMANTAKTREELIAALRTIGLPSQNARAREVAKRLQEVCR